MSKTYGVKKADGTLYPVAAGSPTEALEMASVRGQGSKTATAIGRLVMEGATVVEVEVREVEE